MRSHRQAPVDGPTTDGEERFKAAIAVSRLIGAAQAAKPRGPTSAAEMVDELVCFRRRRESGGVMVQERLSRSCAASAPPGRCFFGYCIHGLKR